jgi:hypothetical protein
MEAPLTTSMNSHGLIATPSRAEANIFDTWNDSTRGVHGVEIIVVRPPPRSRLS